MLQLRSRSLGEFIRLGLLLTTLVSTLWWLSPLPLAPDPTWTLFGAKLTFLSIMMAVGWWQYQYFYEEFRDFYQKIAPAWDGWVALMKSTDELDELVSRAERAGITTAEARAARDQVRRDRERLQGIEKNRQEVLAVTDENLNHYQTAISLLFGVGFTLLVSLVADLIDRTVATHRAVVAVSFGGFVIALIMFVCLMVYYLWVVSSQMRTIRKGAEKYRGIRFS